MTPRTFGVLVAAGGAIFSKVTSVAADYSIAATDKNSRQVGGAAATCADDELYSVLYNSVPGKGVFFTQAFVEDNQHIRDLGVELLKNGTNPEKIIKLITRPEVDQYVLADVFPGPDLRQFGVVDVKGRAAGWTGNKLSDLFSNFFQMKGTVQDDTQGNVDDFTYSIQVDPFITNNTLSFAASAFEREGCDLADRLMLALEAGGRDGQEGDMRCVIMSGIAASSSFLHVDSPDGTTFIHLEVVNAAYPNDAVTLLRKQYDEWRTACPCGEVICSGNKVTGEESKSASMPEPSAIASSSPTISPAMGSLSPTASPILKMKDVESLSGGSAMGSLSPTASPLANAKDEESTSKGSTMCIKSIVWVNLVVALLTLFLITLEVPD